MRFGQYELLGRIAVGGMAEIYRGRAVGDEGFEKPVAIKRILPAYAGDASFVTMLVTEARIHASLSHRNIVQIHDLGISEEGEYFIVLEYVDGRDLGALLDMLSRTPSPSGRTLRLSDAVALYIMIELGEGTHFAHELRGADGQPLGLVHRDISPSNVLVSYAGEVKLSDFGLAKRRTDHSVVGSLKGKLAYMSPEQARSSTLDRRSDVFALGAVLFEMLTGRRLREITDDVEGWRQVASGLVPSARPYRPDLPPALDQLLTRALAPDPRDRFPDARALVAAAREALLGVARAPTSEESELQALLKTLLPPGTPRPPTAPSKVIRLVSKFLPHGHNVTMATPPRRRTPAGGHAAASDSPRAARGLAAQPRDPRGRPRAPGLTPPAPRPAVTAGRPGVPDRWDVDPQRVSFALATSPATAAAAANALAEVPRPVAPPAPRPPTPHAGMPAVAEPGRAQPRAATPSAPFPALVRPITPPRPLRAPSGLDHAPGDRTPESHDLPRPPSRSPVPAPRPRSSFARAVVFATLVIFPAAAAVIHYLVVPLPVLRAWSQPARLEVLSQPSGAEVYLDGHRLSALTPTYTEVQRDRRAHQVEIRKDGFQLSRRSLRFDQSELLTVDVSLLPESRPSFRPMPQAKPVSPATAQAQPPPPPRP
jgi:serine/threonine-protein kinase